MTQQLIEWMEEERKAINKIMESMDIDLRLLHGQQISLLNKAIDKVRQVYKPEKAGEYLVIKDGKEFTSYWDGYFWGYEGEVITGIESWKAKELQGKEKWAVVEYEGSYDTEEEAKQHAKEWHTIVKIIEP